jgi:hypothetical protein
VTFCKKNPFFLLAHQKNSIDEDKAESVLSAGRFDKHLQVRAGMSRVAVVKDATAAPKHPEWGYGYTAALMNYAFLAHAVLTTDEAVNAIKRG